MRVINGQILKKLFISGSNNLYNHYPEIDALNVFPVPDGDTGMNMNLTLTSGCKEIQNRNDTNIYEIAKAFSRGLLMGARGNSGVITSQIFRGFAQGLEGVSEADAIAFSKAMEKGVEVSYKAVVRPVEGTILTVMREATEVLAKQVKKDFTIKKCLEIYLKEARESLKRTPELLPILKEVGVIDSGGCGLIKIFEGMITAIDGDVVERSQATVESDNPIMAAGAKMAEEEFGYCTEFIMSLGPDSVKKPFNEKRFTMVLGSHGNSLVVVHDEDIVKVHVHTMQPGSVLNYAQQFGEFLKLKIENMTEQHHALETGASVEEHVDLVPEEEEIGPKKKYGLIAVSAGKGIDEYFKQANVDYLVSGGQTMNPCSEDFVNAVKKVNAENVFIFPNNSNIVMAAKQAAELIEDVNVIVVPTKTIPQGICAASMFDESLQPDENLEEMTSAMENIKSGELTFAIRDTEICGVQVKKDDYIGMFGKELVVDNPSKVEACKQLLDKMITTGDSFVTVLVGADVTKDEEDEIASHLANKSGVDSDIRRGDQPVYSFIIGVE